MFLGTNVFSSLILGIPFNYKYIVSFLMFVPLKETGLQFFQLLEKDQLKTV